MFTYIFHSFDVERGSLKETQEMSFINICPQCTGHHKTINDNTYRLFTVCLCHYLPLSLPPIHFQPFLLLYTTIVGGIQLIKCIPETMCIKGSPIIMHVLLAFADAVLMLTDYLGYNLCFTRRYTNYRCERLRNGCRE